MVNTSGMAVETRKCNLTISFFFLFLQFNLNRRKGHFFLSKVWANQLNVIACFSRSSLALINQKRCPPERPVPYIFFLKLKWPVQDILSVWTTHNKIKPPLVLRLGLLYLSLILVHGFSFVHNQNFFFFSHYFHLWSCF